MASIFRFRTAMGGPPPYQHDARENRDNRNDPFRLVHFNFLGPFQIPGQCLGVFGRQGGSGNRRPGIPQPAICKGPENWTPPVDTRALQSIRLQGMTKGD
jgi:hypothetical protein